MRKCVLLLCAILLLPARFHAPAALAQAAPNAVVPAPLQIAVTRENGDEKSAAARVVLRFSDGAVLPSGRVRVALYESGKSTKLSEISRRIEARQIAFRVEGDPGTYDVRVLSDNRARTPLFGPQSFTLFGILRENGAWLLNGSPFADNVSGDEAGTASDAGAPLFVAGLKRDLGAKIKGDGRRIIPIAARLEWQTVPIAVFENDSEEALRMTLATALSNARRRGEGNFLGIEVLLATPPFAPALPTSTNAIRVFSVLRRAMNELAPSAALILAIRADENDASTRVLAQVAAQCDAIVIDAQDAPRRDETAWAMKAARRIAEEQPRYDLPIFVRASGEISSHLDLWMGGATGLIRDGNGEERLDSMSRVLARNEGLFAGGATIEDIGLWPVPKGADSSRLYGVLRDAGRIPLLARPAEAAGKEARVLASESLMAQFGEQIDAATIERLRVVAQAGARLYLEGAPLRDENDESAPWRLTKLLGFSGKPRENTTARDTMTLSDAWTFGALRGLQVDARRAVDVQLLPPSTASQAKSERGLDVLTNPRVVATFPDGTPAIVINPVGKGLVMWAPGDFDWKSTEAAAAFYRAVAAWVSPPQVELKNADDEAIIGIRAALRRSQSGAVIVLSLHNAQNETRVVDATVDGAAGVALDLSSERELPLRTEGYRSTARVSVPANGFALVAFAANRKALDEQRNTPRRRAKMK